MAALLDRLQVEHPLCGKPQDAQGWLTALLDRMAKGSGGKRHALLSPAQGMGVKRTTWALRISSFSIPRSLGALIFVALLTAPVCIIKPGPTSRRKKSVQSISCNCS